jgi:hypothetical protein
VVGAGIKEGRRCVSEEALGHEVVCVDGTINVVAVNANSDTHEHLLWPFGDFAINTEEVRSLEGLEPEAEDDGEGVVVE